MSGLGGPMESVGEDTEMKGGDWASAMRILSDMEHDQHSHDRDRDHDRCATPCLTVSLFIRFQCTCKDRSWRPQSVCHVMSKALHAALMRCDVL